jgi:hypothetical protein
MTEAQLHKRNVGKAKVAFAKGQISKKTLGCFLIGLGRFHCREVQVFRFGWAAHRYGYAWKSTGEYIQ